MKKTYLSPSFRELQFDLECDFLASKKGSGTGSDMDDPDYEQDPFSL